MNKPLSMQYVVPLPLLEPQHLINVLLWKLLQATGRILATVFFDLKAYGLENIPRTGGALIVSNHQSYLDPILLTVRSPRRINYMAKEELFKVTPAFTWLLRSLGTFPVYQNQADIHALKESIELLREGNLVNIYSEGARSPDGEIGKIEKGIALIEHRSGVPVIPFVIDGSIPGMADPAQIFPVHGLFAFTSDIP